MKTNFLLLLFITLTISEVTLAETLNKGTKIELKYHLRKDHRSVIEQPFQVFLNASFITIEQDVSSSDVSFYTITITQPCHAVLNPSLRNLAQYEGD